MMVLPAGGFVGSVLYFLDCSPFDRALALRPNRPHLASIHICTFADSAPELGELDEIAYFGIMNLFRGGFVFSTLSAKIAG